MNQLKNHIGFSSFWLSVNLVLKSLGQLQSVLLFPFALLLFTQAATSQTIGSVSVASQVGTVTYGTAGSVSFAVTVVKSGTGTLNVTSFSTSVLPAGVTASFASPGTLSIGGPNGNSGSITLTLTTNNTAIPVTNYAFTVTAVASNTVTSPSGSFTILKKNITVTGITGINKVYNQTVSATISTAAASLTGVINGDIVTLNTGSVAAVFSDKNVGINKTITISGLSISGAGSGNYILVQPTTTANITAASLAVSFTANNKTYDGTTIASIATRNISSGLFAGDVVTISGGTANFSDATAGTGKTVTASGFVLAGTDGGNYMVSPPSSSTTANITPAALTIKANDQSKVYGNLLAGGSGSLLFTATGLQNSESVGSVTINIGSGGSSTDNAGTYAGQITPSMATGGTFNPANYTISYTTGTLTVTPAPVTVTASNQSKTYGAVLSTTGVPGTTFTVTGLKNADAVSAATLTFSGAPAGNLATAAVNTYTITPSGLSFSSGATTNYTVSYATGTLSVAAATLTVTALAQSKLYGNTVATAGVLNSTFSVTGLQNSDAVNGATLNYSGSPTGNLATAAAGSYNITPSLATFSTGTASNYTISYVQGTLSVTPAPLTITANNQSKVYGTVFTGGAGSLQFTSSGLKNGETIATVTITPGSGSAALDAVGTYAGQLAPSLATGGTFNPSNYTITYISGNLTVTPATLTITASTANKVFGTTLTNGSVATGFNVTGLLNGNTVSSVTMTYGAAAGPNANVGTYPSQTTPSAAVGANGFVAGNYTITYTASNIVVSTAPLTITANDVSKIYGNTLTSGAGSTAFSSTGLVTGNTLTSVTITYGTGAAATAAVGTYTGSITPSAAVGANGFLASNYTITYVAGNIIVTQAALTITANNQSKVYGTVFTGGAGSTQFIATGLRPTETVGTVTIAAGSGSAATDAVGTYAGQLTPSLATGGTFNPSNYTITYISGNLTVTPATLTITASTANKVFGTTLTNGSVATGFTATGLLNGNTVSSVTMTYGAAAGPTANVGTYPSQATPSAAVGANGFAAGNYTITYTAGNIVVSTAPLTITANDVNKIYGNALTSGAGSTSFSSTGLVTGNTLTSVTITYGTGAAATAAVGTYTGSVTPSAAVGANGYLASNYTITFVAGSITVTPATLTVTASNQTKAYGATASTTGVLNTTFTVLGLKNTDAINANGATLGYSGTPAGNLAAASIGTYSITPSAVIFSTGSVTNYTIVYVNGTLTVSKAASSVAVTSSGTTCINNNVTLTATVTTAQPDATGSVQFFYGATSLGTATITSGQAILNTTALPAANNSITATYSGDNNYNSSTSPVISVLINPLPTIVTGGTINTICFSLANQSATLPYTSTTNTPTSYSITWSAAANTAGLINQVNTAAAFAGGAGNITSIAIPAGTAAGNYTGTLTVRNNNGCVSTQIAISLAIIAPPTGSNAGSNQTGATTCGITSIALAANTPASGTGLWAITSGMGGSLTSPTSPTSNFSGVVGTTYTLTWTISNTPCTASASQVQIKFNPLPQGSLTANGPYCQTDGGNGKLTFTATAGTGPFTITYNDGTTQYTVNNITSGVGFTAKPTTITSTTAFTLVSVQDQNCIRSSGFTAGSATISVSTPPTQLLITAASLSVDSATGTNIIVDNSETGVLYQLRNNATNANVGPAVSGNGTTIYLPTGNLSATTTFNVLAIRGACSLQMQNLVNIVVDTKIYWVSANNNYFIPTDNSTPANQMQYRKVSTVVNAPVDGRGQYWCTINAKPSGGDALNQAMAGGSGSGFLFSSGTAAELNGTNNNWGATSQTTAAINAISSLKSSLYGPVTELGLNMSQQGYYTFVMRDSGRNKNSDVYIGYTTNVPISFTHNVATQRLVLSDLSTVIIATTGSTPSAQEKIYVRYKIGSNDFSTGTSFITPAARISNDSAIVLLPPQTALSTVYYYFFSSTLSQSELQALTETYKSLACLKYLDNSGTNYSYTLPAAAALYTHNFNTAPTANTNYTVTPDVFNTNFVTGSSVFSSPSYFVTNPAQVQATSGLSPNINIPSNGTTTVTLNFDVKPGFYISTTSLAFWASSNITNVRFSSITVNGVTVGTNITIARNAGTGTATNQTVTTTNCKNLSGTISVILTIANSNASTANFFLDNFSINGYVGTLPDFLGYTWVGITNSNWNTPTNWAPTGIPGANDNVTINTLPAVIITGAQSVKTLTLAGTGNLQIASGASLTVTNNLIYENTAGYSFNCGSTINFTSSSLITVPALQYGNLNLAGGPRQLASGEVTKICGNYTPSASTSIAVGSTVEFNGTSAQAINTNPASFSNLLISNTSATVTSNTSLTIAPSGTLEINSMARLSTGANSLTVTGAVATVNGFLRIGGTIVDADANTLIVNATGTLEYDQKRSGQSDLGIIPTARWNSGSTLSITGLTNPLNAAWFSDGMSQSFSNFTWNTASLTSMVKLNGPTLTIAGTLTITSTGTGQLLLGSTTGGVINCVNFSQTGGILNFSNGTASSQLHVSGNFNHTGGTITETGTSSGNTIYLDGSSGAQALNGSASGSSFVNYEFDNPSGFVVTGSIPLSGNALVKTGLFTGSGILNYNSIGNLTYDVPSSRTTTKVEWSVSSLPNKVTLTGGGSLSLNETKTCEQLILNSGLVLLGSSNLVLNNAVGQGVTTPGTFSTVNMVVTDGAGKLGQIIPMNGPAISIFYPIGNNNRYNPARYTFNSSNQERTLLVGIVNVTHPQVSSSSDYLANSYWTTDITPSAGAYTYSVAYSFSAGAVQGNPSNIKLSRWSGLLWSSVTASFINDTLLASGTVNETTAPLYAPAEWSGRAATTNNVYYWTFPASGSWTTATNWTPNGIPNNGDEVIFNQPATTVVTNVPGGIYLTRLSFSGGGNITLTPGANGSLKVNSSSSYYPQLSIDASTTVNIAGTTAYSFALNVGPGSTGVIYGKVNIRNGDYSITADGVAGLLFESGSICNLGVINTSDYTGYPFGLDGLDKTVVFKSGSLCEQFDGYDPFGQLSPYPTKKVDFKQGSIYRYSNNNTTIVSSKLPFFSRAEYANYEYNSPRTLTSTGSHPFTVRNLTISQGALNINVDASVNSINGDITINGTALSFNPSSGASYKFDGEADQTISGTGTFALNSKTISTINASSKLILNRSITVDGGLTVSGTLNTNSYTITGSTNSIVQVLDGSTIITAHAEGLTYLGNTGSFRTQYRNYSSEAGYVFTAASGNTGNFIDYTSPNNGYVDSLCINSAGTITANNIGNIYVTKFVLTAGFFNVGPKFIYIPANGFVTSTGGRMAAGTNGGTVSFNGTTYPGTPIVGDPQFRNVVVNDTINFINNATINNFMQFNAGASVTTAPIYAAGSRLIYATGGNTSRKIEWDQATPGAPGYPWHVIVQNGTTLNLGTTTPTNLEIGGNLTVGQPNSTGSVTMNSLSQPLKVLGNVYLGATFNCNNAKLTLSTVGGGNVQIGKSLVRYGVSTNDIVSNSRTVIFNGSGNDSISHMITTSPLVYGTQILDNISMQKTGSGDITLKVPLTITQSADFNSGVLNTTSINLLTISNTAGAGVAGTPSNSSFVNGPMVRATNSSTTEYLFPVGASSIASNKYRPCSITPVSTTTTNYTVEFKPLSPSPNFSSQTGLKLTAIDNTCTWLINRNTATNARVSLFYRSPNANWITKTGTLLSANPIDSVAVAQYNQAAYPGNWALTADSTYTSSITMQRLASDENFIYSAANLNTSAGTFTLGLIAPPLPFITSFSPTSGYTGSTIIITGGNFSSTTGVSFGGAPVLSYTVNSPSQITAIVGAGGYGNVAVTNNYGTASLPYFTYLGYITTTPGDWNTGTTWLGGGVPPSATSTNVTIAHNVASTPSSLVGKLTVNTGIALTITPGTTITVDSASQNSGTINVNGTLAATGITYTNSGIIQGNSGNTGNIQLNQGGLFSGTNIRYGANLTNLTFNYISGSPFSVPNTAPYWPVLNDPTTVNVTGATGVQLPTGTSRTTTNVNLNAGLDIQSPNLLIVTGNLQINALTGIITSNAPVYGNASALIYNSSGSYNRSLEWSGATGNPGFPNHVIIQNNTTLVAGGNAGAYTGTVFNTGRDLTIDGGSILQMDGFNMAVPLTIGRNLLINGTLTGSGAVGGDISITGNWTRNAGGVYTHNNRIVSFDNAVNSNITSPGTGEIFSTVYINKTAATNTVTLLSPVTVQSTLNFTMGVVNTSSTNLLSVTNPSFDAITGTPSNSSFVNGPLARATNLTSEYSFPVGSILAATNNYRPVTVTPEATTLTTYTAELKPATPTPNYTNQLSASLTAIDNTVTWNISRSTATNARISLDYKNPGVNNWITSSGATMSPCATCKVAVVQYNNPTANYWTFTASSFTGTPIMERLYTDENPIYSAAILNVAAGAFTFGLQYSVVLPVQLISFNGIVNNGDGLLSWNAADVRDLESFDLEESSNGLQFSRKSTLIANGGLNYTYIDPRLTPGAHFYRLMVKEKSGRTFYSKVVLLTVGKQQTRIIGLKQNPVFLDVTPIIFSSTNQNVSARLVDVAGHNLHNYQGSLSVGENPWKIPIQDLHPGIYFLRITTADAVTATLKFIKQ